MILVTGGAGFIGSNLVAALEARGERVAVSDWPQKDERWRNLAKRNLAATVMPEHLAAFLTEQRDAIRAIFHMGAVSSTTETDLDLIFNTNVRLSRDIWNWCRDHQKVFIYASSAATYGDGANGFVDDENPAALEKLQPLNPYGKSKHEFDCWALQQQHENKKTPPQVAGLKFFNVFGPNEYHKEGQRSVAEQIHPFATRGEAFPLFKSYHPNYADGGQLRDFVWVGDCVNVMLWLFDNPRINGLFNVGSGKARCFADLAAAVYLAMGKQPMITFRDMPEAMRPHYQYFTEANLQKLRKAGFTAPMTSLENGVAQYMKILESGDRYI